jgi:hypothetical protein
LAGPEAGDAGLQLLEWNRQPGHQSARGVQGQHVQGTQTEVQKALAALPVPPLPAKLSALSDRSTRGISHDRRNRPTTPS